MKKPSKDNAHILTQRTLPCTPTHSDAINHEIDNTDLLGFLPWHRDRACMCVCARAPRLCFANRRAVCTKRNGVPRHLMGVCFDVEASAPGEHGSQSHLCPPTPKKPAGKRNIARSLSLCHLQKGTREYLNPKSSTLNVFVQESVIAFQSDTHANTSSSTHAHVHRVARPMVEQENPAR